MTMEFALFKSNTLYTKIVGCFLVVACVTVRCEDLLCFESWFGHLKLLISSTFPEVVEEMGIEKGCKQGSLSCV